MRAKLFVIILIATASIATAQDIEAFYKAQKLANEGKALEAAQLLEKAKTKDNALLEAQGIYFLKSRKYNKAINSFGQISNEEKFLYIAKAYAEQGNADSSVIFLKKYLLSANKRPMPALTLDTSLNKISSTRQWKELWSKQWYQDYQLELDRIQYNIENGKAIDQILLLNSIIEQHHAPRAYFLRAKAYEKTGNIRAAIEDMQTAAKNDNTGLYTKELALLKMKNNDYSGALQAVKRARNINPYDLSLLKLEAEIYKENGNLTAAANALQRIFNQTEDNETGKELAKIYLEQGQYLDAIRVSNKLLQQKEESETYNLRAEAFYRSGNNESAYKDYTMSVDLNPYQPGVYMKIANTAYSLGYKQEACLYWKKCSQEYGNQEAYKQIKIHCKKILKKQ